MRTGQPVSANVPRRGLKPCLLLYFAQAGCPTPILRRVLTPKSGFIKAMNREGTLALIATCAQGRIEVLSIKPTPIQDEGGAARLGEVKEEAPPAPGDMER